MDPNSSASQNSGWTRDVVAVDLLLLLLLLLVLVLVKFRLEFRLGAWSLTTRLHCMLYRHSSKSDRQGYQTLPDTDRRITGRSFAWESRFQDGCIRACMEYLLPFFFLSRGCSPIDYTCSDGCDWPMILVPIHPTSCAAGNLMLAKLMGDDRIGIRSEYWWFSLAPSIEKRIHRRAKSPSSKQASVSWTLIKTAKIASQQRKVLPWLRGKGDN